MPDPEDQQQNIDLDEATNTGPEEDAKEKKGIESLPDWAQKEITDTRTEAGNYRTKLREAEAALKDAKSQEDIDAAIASLAESNAKLEREILVRDVADSDEIRLPRQLWGYLKGNTKEELVAEAKELAALFVPADAGAKKVPDRIGGGLTPNDNAKSQSLTPSDAAKQYSRWGK